MKKIVLGAMFLCSIMSFAQVGIGTTTPRSTLEINGNLSLKVVSLNGGPGGSATVIDDGTNDGTYLNLTPTSGNVEFILPDATLYPGRIYILRNVSDTENAVIYSFGFVAGAGNGVEFYRGDGRTSVKSITMTPDTAADNNDFTKTLIFISDGSNWTYGRLGM
jgi:hypothetical protein